jgi:hypothetical protein
MEIYLFASDRHPSVSAFSSDKAGGNLPTDYAPWLTVNNGRAIPIGSSSDKIAATIEQDGYFLLSARARHARAKRDDLARHGAALPAL